MKVGRAHVTLATLLAIVAAVVAGVLAPPARTAFAHANVARSEPEANSVSDEPPGQVVIWFTEPLEPGFSEIQVLDAQGRRVNNGDSIVDKNDPTVMSVTLTPLANGTYTVAWKNLSTVDGHRVRGSFVFSVGEPISGALQVDVPGQPLLQSPAEPVLRWLMLLTGLAVVGGLAFELLVSRPVLTGRHAAEGLRRLGERAASRTLKLLWLAMGLFLLASLAQLVVQTAVVHDISLRQTLGGPLFSILTDTDWGRLWLWRVGLLLAMAAVLGLVFTIPAREQDHDPVAEFFHCLFRALALGVGAGMLLTLSLASHGAATTEIKTAAVLSDYLHLLAAGFWVGGLFHFALAVPLFMTNLSAAERGSAVSALVPRFSTLAFLSVGTLVITGLYGAWAQVTILQAVATPYGWTLLTKLGLVLPLLSLGALNLLFVRPRLGKGGEAGRWLRRFVTGEALLAVLVLVSVGMLTSLEPARQVASREGIGQENKLGFQDTAEGADVALEIEPAQVGPNRLLVSLKDRLGNPITNATDVAFVLTYLDADLGENTVTAQHLGDGRYVVEEGLFSVAGPWQAALVVRRPDAFDARTAFRFEIGGAGAAGSASIVPAAGTGKLLWGIELVVIGVLFLGAGVALGGWWTRRGATVMGPGLAAALAGLVLAFTSQVGQPEPGVLRNPFPPNPDSLEMGRQVYTGNCQSCHGTSGRGDGPAAAGVDPPPADLVVHVPLHPERDLFRFVNDGISGTSMAPLGETLTDEEIWHLINYIATFE